MAVPAAPASPMWSGSQIVPPRAARMAKTAARPTSPAARNTPTTVTIRSSPRRIMGRKGVDSCGRPGRFVGDAAISEGRFGRPR